jgi:hypothetical protein
MTTFDIGRFVEGCFESLGTDRPVDAIRELLTVKRMTCGTLDFRGLLP